MTKEFKATDHSFVPLHEILSDDDIKKLLKQYDIEKSQLPIISKNDVIVKEIDAKKGNVIKITRDSPTAGKSVYYRLVK